MAVIQEAYVHGVSTRSVDDLVKAMGAGGMSKSQVHRLCAEIDERVNAFLTRPLEGAWPYLWLDATYLKVREGEPLRLIGREEQPAWQRGRKQEPPDHRERHEEIGLGSDDRCHRDPGDEPEQQRRLHEIKRAVVGGGRGHRVSWPPSSRRS